ncbi:hypothetical protein ACLGI4_17155 [Streptomyces sp. HMX112]|uniref:hypothetical protein n=1 Tax=Streptomyces sp. HMX112 TaxID=3390850 RepID=UPI003A804828
MTRHTAGPAATGARDRIRVPHPTRLAADQTSLADARTITAPGMTGDLRGES